jgi:hypothetical protein
VSIFYAQSGSIIRFMVEVLGEEKFGDFLDALATDTVDGALMDVYGFDSLGLENEWRKAIGLPEVATGGGSSSSSEPVPTLVPFGSGQSSAPQETPQADEPETATTADEADGSSSNALPIVLGVLVLFVLTAGGVYIRQTRG